MHTNPPNGYRGRLAPSPTGLLHVGHARTFWTAYSRARERGGTLVMRIDDLDPERSRNEFADAAIEDLRWLGIRWQEGPRAGVDDEPIYPGTCRHLSAETAQLPGPTASRFAPEMANWRFRVNDGVA